MVDFGELVGTNWVEALFLRSGDQLLTEISNIGKPRIHDVIDSDRDWILTTHSAATRKISILVANTQLD